EMLPGDSSDLIMAMIQKFQERDFRHHFPELNQSEKILVMIDEAHRSQYNLLGSNMDKALPNATRIVYTGTPIEQTERTFLNYLDKYSMRTSIDDKVTLEIVYEGRTQKAEVEDRKGAEEKFEDVFSEYNIMERLHILGFTSKRAYMEAEDTIRAKAKNMVQHYVHEVFPNGYKAQVVAYSQEAAVRYNRFLNEAIDEEIIILEEENKYGIDIEKLKSMKTAVVISSQSTNERPHIKKHTNSDDHKTHVASFKLPFGKESDEGIKGDVGILIVHNMLITGFDAPIEQVMYLDRVMKSHNLLQAVARVNRVYDENKKIGRIVDYVGVGHHLKEAVDFYDELEQKDILDSLIPFEDEYNKVIDAQRNLNEFFEKHKIEDLSDYDTCFDLFYDENIRFEFISLYREFTKGIDAVFPRKEALDFMDDYLLFAEINVMAGRHFHDSRMSMTGIPEKMRSVTDEFLKSKGIDVKVEPISIMDEDFQSNVKKRKSNKTKAAEVEHALRHFLEINMEDDPDLYASFVEAMEEIMRDFADNWSVIYRRLEALRQKMRKASKEPTHGLDLKKKMPFFRSLRKEIFNEIKLDDGQIAILVRLTETIFDVIEREIQLTEFWDNISAQNRLKKYIQEVILSEAFISLPNIRNSRSHIISRMMEIAQNKHDTILYSK
ncbi:MAG: type I restriction endonuclease subunit R, partial [Bacteroidetes bacterium]|nr:type I restriction endonuclease subunit R [Bacteroidota bacterium]